ncbi:MAG: hypothetical protein ACYTFW_02595 [Planctomycetota bacterium]|jgi:hypothetical protein
MALTVTIDDKSVFGNRKVRMGSIAFDSSYPTDGEPFTAAMFALSKIKKLRVYPAAGYVVEVDHTNSKVKVFWNDYDAGADAALIEVTNATNLSTLSCEFDAYGIGG